MRGMCRWLAVLVVAATVTLLGAFTLHRAFAPSALIVDSTLAAIPADGFTTVSVKLHSSSGRDLHDLQATVEDPHRAAVESVVIHGDSAAISIRTGVLPGEVTLRLAAPSSEPREFKLQTKLDVGDSVADGTPDFLRLHDSADRAAFRRWFTLLAESEFYRKQPTGEIEDCAALLRYAYREALRQHDAAWAKAIALPIAPAAGDIRQYQYPFTPLGAALFRVRQPSFTADDLTNSAFGQFADAKTLWQRNSYFVGRDLALALPGDLLFYRQRGHDLPFHAMIFLGPSQIEPGGEPMVIYHTGPDGITKGEIRRPTLAQLMNYPDPRWRPVQSNPGFLGVYRWNILRGAD